MTTGGVGIYFQQEVDGRVFVKSVPPSGPAGRTNGLVRKGDEVRKVNGIDVKGLSLMDMRKLIIGEVGTEVELVFLRGSHEVAVRLQRDVSESPTGRSNADESGAEDSSSVGGGGLNSESESRGGGRVAPPSSQASLHTPPIAVTPVSPGDAKPVVTPSIGEGGVEGAGGGEGDALPGQPQQQQQHFQQQQQQQQQQQPTAAAAGPAASTSSPNSTSSQQQAGAASAAAAGAASTPLPPSWTETGPRFVEALHALEAMREQLNAKLDEAFERLYEHKYAVERQLQQEHERIEKDRMQLEHERAHFINSSMQLHEEVRRQAAIRHAVTQVTAPFSAVINSAAVAIAPPVLGEGVLHLNVGGKVFATSVSTLRSQPGSLLDSLASGAYAVPRDSEGRLFLDRSPKYFEMVLEYLRTHQLAIPVSAEDRRALRVEADFFGIVGLSKMLEAIDAPPQGVTASPSAWGRYQTAPSTLSQSLRSAGAAPVSYETPRRGLLATDFLQQ